MSLADGTGSIWQFGSEAPALVRVVGRGVANIVGSTDLLTRLGERAWSDVGRQHFSVLREALAKHEGSEVKNTGEKIQKHNR